MDFLIKYLIDERNEEISIPKDINDKKLLFRSLMNVRPPLDVSDEFLHIQDEFLTNETLNKNLTSAEDISVIKGKLFLYSPSQKCPPSLTIIFCASNLSAKSTSFCMKSRVTSVSLFNRKK